MNEREKRVRRLEELYSVGAPTDCCCATPSADAFKAAVAERQRLHADHPEMTHLEVLDQLQPTSCARTGGPLCADAAAYFTTVRERVGRLERSTTGLNEAEL